MFNRYPYRVILTASVPLVVLLLNWLVYFARILFSDSFTRAQKFSMHMVSKG